MEANRHELERRAYGRRDTDEQQRDAIAAQQQLALLDKAESPVSFPVAEGEPQRGADADDAPEIGSPVSPEAAATGERSWRPTRTVFVVAVVAAALVGSAATVGIVAALSAARAPVADTPQSSAIGIIPGINDPVNKLAATSRWFSGTQTAADRYPFQPARPVADFVPSSTRLVETSNVVGNVWVAQAAKPAGGFCMMVESPVASDRTRTGESECVSAETFFGRGLTLHSGGAVVHWTPTAITATSG